MKKKKEKNEERLKADYFYAQNELRTFLFDKYWKYHDKPIILKRNTYTKQKVRIGFYDGFDMPTFINDARFHRVVLGKEKYYICDNEFEIYKKKIKDKDGKYSHYVDVKCPKCAHIEIYNMRYLVWNMNCKKCLEKITTNDRVKKEKFILSDFR